MDAFSSLHGGSVLWQLPGPLYCVGAPVLIREASLLARGEKPVCRVTIQNIGPLTLRAVTIAVQPLDGEGVPLGLELPYRYRKLSVNRDGCFGARTEIELPVEQPASFSLRVLQVDYAGGEPWRGNAVWTPLAPRQTLEDFYEDPALAEQFRVRYGIDCRYAPAEDRDLWLCTCGAVNRRSEDSCHVCHRVRSAQLDVSAKSLHAETLSRQKNEERLEEELSADRRRLQKKLLIAAGIVIPLLFLAVALLITVPKQWERRQQYEAAQSLIAMGQYQEAAEAFAALGDYADSAEQAELAVPYAKARDLMSRAARDDDASLVLIGHSRTELNDETNAAMILYAEAETILRGLGDYRDSPSLADRCTQAIEENHRSLRQASYDEAAALLEARSYSAAREAFLEMNGFDDSEEQAVECVYRKAVALLSYIQKYDVRGVYASITMDPAQPSRFALSTEKAVSLGEHSISDLLDACGEDLSDVSLTGEVPEGLLPIADAVRAMFTELDGYADSAACLSAIAEATDYTRDFWLLCENGDLQGAYNWLNAYNGEFENRQYWLDTLSRYFPFARAWGLYMGDATVLPLTAGAGGSCNYFVTRVLLHDGAAWLRIGGDDFGFEMRAELGSTDFRLEQNGSVYLAVITSVGRFSYMRYGSQGNLISSCEYSPAE